MNVIQRKQDIITGNEDLEYLYTFRDFPVFMGCVTGDSTMDLRRDLNFYISRSSGMIQIDPLLPLEVVYQSEHSSGTTGPSWMQHHESLAKFIHKYRPKKVFEIGGLHGILSRCYYDLDKDIDWTILEPNPIPIEDLKAKIIKGFFQSSEDIPLDVDMLVHSHVIEHIYNPSKFFKDLSSLPTGIRMCFSMPNLKRHMSKNIINVMNFEHTYLCSEEFIDWFLETGGFEILEKIEYQEDHSVFYSTVKINDPKQIFYPNFYEENKRLFLNYVEYHKKLVDHANTESKKYSRVFLFGAHAFCHALQTFGLDNSKIICLLDNSDSKHGKRLYGTDFNIQSPKILKNEDAPAVILPTSVYSKEIKEDILNNINPRTVFIE